jgi:hypothetical protein
LRVCGTREPGSWSWPLVNTTRPCRPHRLLAVTGPVDIPSLLAVTVPVKMLEAPQVGGGEAMVHGKGLPVLDDQGGGHWGAPFRVKDGSRERALVGQSSRTAEPMIPHCGSM